MVYEWIMENGGGIGCRRGVGRRIMRGVGIMANVRGIGRRCRVVMIVGFAAARRGEGCEA